VFWQEREAGLTEIVDTGGIETEVPMDNWVQIAVEESGKPLNLQMHRILSDRFVLLQQQAPRKPEPGLGYGRARRSGKFGRRCTLKPAALRG